MCVCVKDSKRREHVYLRARVDSVMRVLIQPPLRTTPAVLTTHLLTWHMGTTHITYGHSTPTLTHNTWGLHIHTIKTHLLTQQYMDIRHDTVTIHLHTVITYLPIQHMDTTHMTYGDYTPTHRTHGPKTPTHTTHGQFTRNMWSLHNYSHNTLWDTLGGTMGVHYLRTPSTSFIEKNVRFKP